MSLRGQIEQEIREHGPIPFSRYMEICLYDPKNGYYSRHTEQFGKAGDFYTSSDVHAVFGRLLARQFEEMWQALDRPPQIEILELGPGRGLLARDILDWSQKKFPDFFAAVKYTLQETSPSLRAKLRVNLDRYIASAKAVVPEEGPNLAQSFSGGFRAQNEQGPETRPTLLRTCSASTPLIVFANEFFDALPVEILSRQGKLHIGLENNRLHEIWLPPTSQELEFLNCSSVRPKPGERLEIGLTAQRWANEIAAAICHGFLVVFDYGYTRDEQFAGRHRGTLMTYRQHSAGTNPYEAPGEQDITTHVNFTAVAAAVEQRGMQVQKLRTQAQFLMGIGEKNQFEDAFEDCRLPQERAKVTLQLKHLVTPAGMGETFHVLLASRSVSADRISALSGLTFGTGA